MSLSLGCQVKTPHMLDVALVHSGTKKYLAYRLNVKRDQYKCTNTTES